ncbi:MAG: fatty acyl-AMP ligase [Cyanothece sp. SIO2G6]|nr:fatty acyl-AMP ligase [Cyanothece sp. SIO2G6]
MIMAEFSTLIDLLQYRAIYQADQIAYTFLKDGEEEHGRLTYRELDQSARSIASHLRTIAQPGDRALMLYPSGLEFLTAFFGCLYAGIVAVPAYPPRRNQKLTRLEAIVSDAQPKVVLSIHTTLEQIQAQWADHPQFEGLSCVATDTLAGQSGLTEPSGAIKAEVKTEVKAEDLAFLQYTSGSTGQPKGVMVSHGNIIYNQQMIKAGFQHDESTIFVGWLPLFHDMGLIGNVLQPLYLGIHCVLMSPEAFLQKPIRWLRAISRYRATTSGGPNFAYDACIKRISTEQRDGLDLSSWTVAFNGAEPVRAETLERFSAAFADYGFRPEACYPCYGMAETTLLVSGGIPGQPSTLVHAQAAALEHNKIEKAPQPSSDTRTLVSCGLNILEQQLIIVDPDTLTQCSEGQVGEIWVAGPHVAAGYWRNPDASVDTFGAHLADTGADTGAGPFLRTGDLGCFVDGELYVTGRIKDVIIIRGQNHYPQDIERTVQASNTALRPNCGAAFTVEHKNQSRLVIVQEVERTALRKLDAQSVIGNIIEAVTANHSLQVFKVILIKPTSIPKTSSGKIQRHACRLAFLEERLATV